LIRMSAPRSNKLGNQSGLFLHEQSVRYPTGTAEHNTCKTCTSASGPGELRNVNQAEEVVSIPISLVSKPSITQPVQRSG
jgi:hypothetical protein